jgi:cold shock CspA family protein
MPLGRVVAFDEQRGLGTVRADSGAEHAFHCTAIVDGSRRIEVGTSVCFVVVAGHRGEWEAAEIEPVGGAAPPTAR